MGCGGGEGMKLDKLNPKFTEKNKHLRIAKTFLKKNKKERTVLPVTRTDVIIMKMV